MPVWPLRCGRGGRVRPESVRGPSGHAGAQTRNARCPRLSGGPIPATPLACAQITLAAPTRRREGKETLFQAYDPEFSYRYVSARDLTVDQIVQLGVAYSRTTVKWLHDQQSIVKVEPNRARYKLCDAEPLKIRNLRGSAGSASQTMVSRTFGSSSPGRCRVKMARVSPSCVAAGATTPNRHRLSRSAQRVTNDRNE
jgi:hypothetical protein